MKLTDLLNKLIEQNAKDNIYAIEDIVNNIKKIYPKESTYVNSILDVIENKRAKLFSLIMLTYTLREVYLNKVQTNRVFKMFSSSFYEDALKEYLVKILAYQPIDKYPYIVNSLYIMFKNETSIEKKILLAEVLINTKNRAKEVSSWLYIFAIDNTLPDTLEDINTLALKTECCEVLALNKKYLGSAKNGIFYLIKECKFLKITDEHQWGIIKSSFYKIDIEKKDISYILKLAKDKSLISYHRIKILSLLEKVPLDADIINELDNMLLLKDEEFEDFNLELKKLVLKIKSS